MQAVRAARPLARSCVPSTATFSTTSALNATVAAHTGHGHGHGHVAKGAEELGESIIPLSNVQAQWETMSEAEQSLVHRQLEELQKKDWRGLSLDEKRAAYWVSFGPHGTRVPATKPGEPKNVLIGIVALIGATGLLWTAVRSQAGEPPRTLNKQWEEASTEKAKEQKMNPITGMTSEGYKGKGFVQSK